MNVNLLANAVALGLGAGLTRQIIQYIGFSLLHLIGILVL